MDIADMISPIFTVNLRGLLLLDRITSMLSLINLLNVYELLPSFRSECLTSNLHFLKPRVSIREGNERACSLSLLYSCITSWWYMPKFATDLSVLMPLNQE